MKILYGVQGTGNGHISRARQMAKHFKKQNADVTYLFSGRSKDKLFDMEIFGDFYHREGLTFVTESGSINYVQTALNNDFVTFARDIATLNLDQFDVIISDFEPVTAWAANLQLKPLIATGHQYAFGENTPVAGENFIAKSVMKMFAPSKVSIGQHWHPYNYNILPPIVDTSLNSKPPHGAFVVYLPFENQKRVTQLLQRFKRYQFIQYSSELEDGQQGNVTLRKASHEGFKRDLCGAKGVICNSGFELNSECLHLGIPVLTRPVSGQMEQLSNAKALKQLGYAEVMNQVNSHVIGRWLQRNHAVNPRKMPDVAEHLVRWILSGQWHKPEQLSHKLWKEYGKMNNVHIQLPRIPKTAANHFLPEVSIPPVIGKLYSAFIMNLRQQLATS